MAPSDGTITGRTHAASSPVCHSTTLAHSAARQSLNSATSTTAISNNPPLKRYNKLSLTNRKRMRFELTTADGIPLKKEEEIISDVIHSNPHESPPPFKRLRTESSNKIDHSIMNGHNSHHKLLESGRYSASSNSGVKSVSSASSSQTSIASLCNMGNTCFLNSVLYTLRFTPGFLHNLHHLVNDLGLGSHHHAASNSKDKRGGRGGSSSIANNPASSSADPQTERINDVIEQMHDLFRNMSTVDDHVIERESSGNSSSREPIPPTSFLHAVGKMKFIEGNQQQDAHELLIKLLTMFWDIKPPPNNGSLPITPATSVPEDEGSGSDAPSGKKGDKKKGLKKSFLASNGHISSSSSVKLVSSNPKLDPNQDQPSSLAKDDQPSSVIKPAGETGTNFVNENFVGKTVLRTKCLECETSTYLSDKFINIDISLAFDDDLSETMSNGFINDESVSSSSSLSQRSNGGGNALSVADLFLKQMMASETLRENNKYLCVECSRHNEAQRSVQYELLPKVLVLQLKRFTATNNKINDFIPTPFTMSCFCTQCLPPDQPPLPPGESRPPPKHHYRLFAVIMHLGATLASGHYIAYVRASVDLNSDYSRCPKASQVEKGQRSTPGSGHSSSGTSGNGSGNVSGNNGKRGIMKYFSRNSDSSKSGGGDRQNHSSGSTPANLSSNPGAHGHVINGVENGKVSSNGIEPPCRSANCCGMQRVLCQLNNRDHHRCRQRSQESLNSSSNGNHSSETESLVSNGGSHMEDIWLECDDENISPISRRQFEEELNSKQSATTPYLLFYERIEETHKI